QADPLDAGTLLGLLKIAEQRGEFERVIQLGGDILRGEAQWPQSRAIVARAYIRLDQGDQAVAVLEGLVETAPGEPWVHNNLGTAYFELGRFSEAVMCFETALELDPSYAKARQNLDTALAAEAEAKGQ
ncbi:MAG: tetratricopeptide repeat protein, partial [Planctomycetota bacterium]